MIARDRVRTPSAARRRGRGLKRLLPPLAAGAALMLLAAAAPPAQAGAPRPEADRYDHFIYLRHDVTDGTAKTDTLVLATVKPDGVDLKDVYTRRNLHIGWRPLAAGRGKLYAIHIDALLAPQTMGAWMSLVGVSLAALLVGLMVAAATVARRGVR